MRTRATALLERGDEFLAMHRFRDGEEYYVLPGGGIEEGETAEQAVIRELYEETSIKGEIIKNLFSFDQPDFNMHHEVFLIKHNSEEPKLPLDSIESQIANENNKFEPKWIKKTLLKDVNFYPDEQKRLLEELFKPI